MTLTAVQNAAFLGQIDTLRDIWYHDPDSFNESLDKFGRSLLMYSLLGGQLECAKFLHLCGQSLTHLAKNRSSVLHCAVLGNSLDCCQWLVEDHSFDIFIEDKIGRTPLHHACLNGFQLIIDYLIDRHRKSPQTLSRSPYGEPKNGDTILHLVARGGHAAILSHLLSTSDIALLLNHQNKLGLTALHVACLYGNLSSAVSLLRAGANYSLQTMGGETVREIVEREGYQEIIDIITSIATIGYRSHEDEETKSEPYIFKAIVPETPKHVKEALQILQAMNELKTSHSAPTLPSDQTDKTTSSRFNFPTASPRHSSQSSTLMASAGYKSSGNQSLSFTNRNDGPGSMAPRLTHRSSNSDDKPEKRFVISDFDDDTSSVSDQGDDSRRNSLSSYDLDF